MSFELSAFVNAPYLGMNEYRRHHRNYGLDKSLVGYVEIAIDSIPTLEFDYVRGQIQILADYNRIGITYTRMYRGGSIYYYVRIYSKYNRFNVDAACKEVFKNYVTRCRRTRKI